MGRYSASWPLQTHWMAASCKEVDCPHFIEGWKTVVPDDSPQAAYIRHDKTRHHQEYRVDDGDIAFVFPSGQRCYNSPNHRRKLERGPWLTINSPSYNPFALERYAVDSIEWMEKFNQDMALRAKGGR